MYAWQAAVEVVGVGLGTSLLYVIGEKKLDEEGELVGVGDAHVWVMEPDYTRVDIMKRVLAVEKAAESGEVPMCEYAQYPCGFFWDHADDDPAWRKNEIELDEDDAEELGKLARRYTIAHQNEQTAKEAKKKIGKDIAKIWDRLDAKGGKTRFEYGDVEYRVNDVVQKRQGAVDEKRLTADGIDVDKYRKDGYEIRYPKIVAEEG